jgi:lipoic acid synthetase
MILGNICTRDCTFCAITRGSPPTPDPREPEHIAEAVKVLALNSVVITSVTRDDLPDGGASHLARTTKVIHSYDKTIPIEVLIPDFQSSPTALKSVVDAQPSVLNHNLETVPRLYPEVRPSADYHRSLDLLLQAKLLNSGLLTKSGLMLGLGETRDEVIEAMSDMRQAGCDILSIGQYLQPSFQHHKVVRYIPPEEFEEYKSIGRELGFLRVVSGPLVRSSFRAFETYRLAKELTLTTAMQPKSHTNPTG